MIIKIIDKDFTVIWDGIFYKKLSNYPEISDWELRTIIEFIEYENKYNRTCQIECEDKNLLDKIKKEILYKKYCTCASAQTFLSNNLPKIRLIKKKLYLCPIFCIINRMKQILIVIGIIAIACILLCIRVILVKGGRFSSQHISENKRMKQDQIHCATSQDREARRKNNNQLDVNQL